MDDVDKMVNDLLSDLNVPGESTGDLLRRAINVANLQHQYSQHQVGLANQELIDYNPMVKSMLKPGRRLIISLANNDMELGLMRTVISRRIYAARLGRGLDRLVEMYSKAVTE